MLQQPSRMAPPSQKDRWRELLSQLSSELEWQQARLQELEQQNQLRSAHQGSADSFREPEPVVAMEKSVHEAPPPAPASSGTLQSFGPSSSPSPSRKHKNVTINAPESHSPSDLLKSSEMSLSPAFAGYQESASMDVGDILEPQVIEAAVGPSHDFRAGPKSTASLMEKRRVQMMLMRAEKTKKFIAEKSWYVINPESNRFVMTWQMVTTGAMVFVAFITPLQVGLFEMQLDALMVFSLCVDTIFLLDMILQFFTMYPRRTARGIQWEHHLGKISRHYMKTWFPLDFITLIPWDVISLAIPGENNLREFKGIKVIRALRLLKLMRIFRSSKVIHKLEITLSIPYQQFALIKFLLVLVLVCHWLACLWAMTVGIVDPGYPQWIDDIALSDSEFGINTKASPFRIYVASFYFCCYTMTSVGYGDIGPKNILERFFCIAIVLVAGLCWAYILGEVGAIVTDINSENQGFRKKMNSLNRMMQEQGLPHGLRRRLRSFFLQNKHQAQFAKHQKLLDTMSPQLQAEVSTALNLQWLKRVWFFRQFMKVIESKESHGINTDFHRACISDISHCMESRAFAQEEMFGDVQVLYILSKGLVALNSKIGLYGAVWGEDFVLSDASLIRRVSAFALTYLEVLCLTHHQFMEVIKRRKSTCPQLAQIVRTYCVRIATRRGILSEAQRRNRGARSRHTSPHPSAGTGAPVELCPVLPLPGSLAEVG